MLHAYAVLFLFICNYLVDIFDSLTFGVLILV
uniref:Uncharacterized protein n=1 Tax=Arundo donax TaxID=35708 RepID=A0A0A8ZE42_ARUDO